MRKVVILSVAIALTLIGTGCIAVVKGGAIAQERQAVVLDGQVYIVDLSDQSVVKVDPDTMANAEIVSEDIVVSDDD